MNCNLGNTISWSVPMSFVESEMAKIPDSPGIYEIGMVEENNFVPLYLDYSDNSLRWAYYGHEQTKANDDHDVGQFLPEDRLGLLRFRWCVTDKPRTKCIELINSSTHGNGSSYMYLRISKVKEWKNNPRGVEQHHTNRLNY